MGVKLFTSKLLKEQLSESELTNLVAKFRAYKDLSDHGTFFGRDADYNRPASVREAGLWHVHLADAESGPFKLRIAKFNRKSNTALVYCHGFYSNNHILLISVLQNAHDLYDQHPHSWHTALVKIADGFRCKY
jgi:mRNA interferase YafO